MSRIQITHRDVAPMYSLGSDVWPDLFGKPQRMSGRDTHLHEAMDMLIKCPHNLERMAGDKLGEGVSVVTYALSDTLVLKKQKNLGMTYCGDRLTDGNLAWAVHCMLKPAKWKPVIYGVHKTEDTFYILSERLRSAKFSEDDLISRLSSYMRLPVSAYDAHLEPIVHEIRTAYTAAGYDIYGNVMYRDEQFVVNDPFVGVPHDEANRDMHLAVARYKCVVFDEGTRLDAQRNHREGRYNEHV